MLQKSLKYPTKNIKVCVYMYICEDSCVNHCCELVFHQSRLILQSWQYRGRSLSANREASAYSAGKQWCSAPLRPLIFTHRHQRPTRAIG